MTEQLPLRRIDLPNSLQLVCHDDTRRYFGDYHLVRLLLTLPIPLESRFFEDEAACLMARTLLPDPLLYSRSAERMGVPSAQVEGVRVLLMDDLLCHAGSYLGSMEFPRRFIQVELARLRTGKRRTIDFPVFRGA